MKQHLEKIIKTKLTKKDIELIKAFAKGGYRGRDYDSGVYIGLNYRLQVEFQDRFADSNGEFCIFSKIEELCRIFTATSLQEIIRNLLFYKFINVTFEDNYPSYLEKFYKEKYCRLINFKKRMLSIAGLVDDDFKQFCLNWKNDGSDEDRKLFKKFLLKADKSTSIQKSFSDVNGSLNNCFNHKRTLEDKSIIDSIIFKFIGVKQSDDNYNKLKKNVKYLKENAPLALAYLYLTVFYINNLYPLNIKRGLNSQERCFIYYLLNKGDEISYFKETKIQSGKFEKLINGLYKNFGCLDLKSVLSVYSICKDL